MFSQLLFVRLRAAEKALKADRIDEAYRVASAKDLREHARGAAVLAALTPRFLERARNHYRSDRFSEALLDLERAEAGNAMQDEIEELRGFVQVVAAEQKRREASRRGRVDRAQRRIERGSLAAGKEMLEQVANKDRAAQDALRRANERAKDAGKAAEQAFAFLKAGQFNAAAERIRRAKSFDAHSENVARVETELCREVLEGARKAIEQGNLSRAAGELSCLGNLGNGLPHQAELAEVLSLANDARSCIERFDFSAARRNVMSLARRLPKVKWVDATIDQLRQLEELYTAITAGPLGDRLRTSERAGKRPIAKQPKLGETIGLRDPDDSGLPNRMLLLVDGGGSYLIIRGGQASVGRAAAEAPADIPLQSDIAERHANITRVDDDYFLFATRSVEIDGRLAQHTLLQDGERIVLGKKAKFTFRLPTRKSSTAVLDLSDTTKMSNDVRRVVLFQQNATIANSPTAHIYCRHAGPTLVLFERNGAMWVRARADGHVDTEPMRLPFGESVDIGGATLVISPWQVAGPMAKNV